MIIILHYCTRTVLLLRRTHTHTNIILKGAYRIDSVAGFSVLHGTYHTWDTPRWSQSVFRSDRGSLFHPGRMRTKLGSYPTYVREILYVRTRCVPIRTSTTLENSTPPPNQPIIRPLPPSPLYPLLPRGRTPTVLYSTVSKGSSMLFDTHRVIGDTVRFDF